jgi:hypothetical protein
MLALAAACAVLAAAPPAPARSPRPPAAPGAPAAPAAPKEPVVVDLTPAGIAATISVPAGTTMKESFGDAALKNGPRFQLLVHPGDRDLARWKAEVVANDVNKLKRWVSEAPDALVYETTVMNKPEFHFVANVDVGGKRISCEDDKGPVYALADVQAMLAACRTLKPTGRAAAAAPAGSSTGPRAASAPDPGATVALTAGQEKELREAIPALFAAPDAKLKVARLRPFAAFGKPWFCGQARKKIAGLEGKCAMFQSGQLTLAADSPVLSGYRVVYDKSANVVAAVADLKPDYGGGTFRDVVVPLLEEKWGKAQAQGDRLTWAVHKDLTMMLAREGGHWQILEIYKQ